MANNGLLDPFGRSIFPQNQNPYRPVISYRNVNGDIAISPNDMGRTVNIIANGSSVRVILPDARLITSNIVNVFNNSSYTIGVYNAALVRIVTMSAMSSVTVICSSRNSLAGTWYYPVSTSKEYNSAIFDTTKNYLNTSTTAYLTFAKLTDTTFVVHGAGMVSATNVYDWQAFTVPTGIGNTATVGTVISSSANSYNTLCTESNFIPVPSANRGVCIYNVNTSLQVNYLTISGVTITSQVNSMTGTSITLTTYTYIMGAIVFDDTNLSNVSFLVNIYNGTTAYAYYLYLHVLRLNVNSPTTTAVVGWSSATPMSSFSNAYYSNPGIVCSMLALSTSLIFVACYSWVGGSTGGTMNTSIGMVSVVLNSPALGVVVSAPADQKTSSGGGGWTWNNVVNSLILVQPGVILNVFMGDIRLSSYTYSGSTVAVGAGTQWLSISGGTYCSGIAITSTMVLLCTYTYNSTYARYYPSFLFVPVSGNGTIGPITAGASLVDTSGGWGLAALSPPMIYKISANANEMAICYRGPNNYPSFVKAQLLINP